MCRSVRADAPSRTSFWRAFCAAALTADRQIWRYVRTVSTESEAETGRGLWSVVITQKPRPSSWREAARAVPDHPRGRGWSPRARRRLATPRTPGPRSSACSSSHSENPGNRRPFASCSPPSHGTSLGGQRLGRAGNFVSTRVGVVVHDAENVGVLQPRYEERPAVGAPLVSANFVPLLVGGTTGCYGVYLLVGRGPGHC